MARFEQPEEEAARSERRHEEESRPERIRQSLDSLQGQLKSVLEQLKEAGFPVGPDCRIDIFEYENSGNDRNYARRLGAEWSAKATPEDVQNKETGELFEIVKTLGVNNHWFEGRLVSVRTSKYDDYVNGVDNLIFDTQTGQPIAAIDDTTGGSKLEDPKVKERIRRGGQIKYGASYNKEEGIIKKSLSKLPVFIISTVNRDLLAMAKDLAANKQGFESTRGVSYILDRLLEQYEKIATGEVKISDKELLDAYHRAGKLFGEL